MIGRAARRTVSGCAPVVSWAAPAVLALPGGCWRRGLVSAHLGAFPIAARESAFSALPQRRVPGGGRATPSLVIKG
jgi:hypothetical protein